MYLKGIGIACHLSEMLSDSLVEKDQILKQTERGLRDVALAVAKAKPHTIVVITPHGAVFDDAVAISYDTKLSGNMSVFGVSRSGIEKPCDMGLLDELRDRLAEAGCRHIFVNSRVAEDYGLPLILDRGSLVPLSFIDKVYPDYQLVHMTVGDLSFYELYRFGHILRQAIEVAGHDTVIIASGDLAHLPRDRNPEEVREVRAFNQKIAMALRNKNFETILTMPADAYSHLRQCGLKPLVTALGAFDGIVTESLVFSETEALGIGCVNAWIADDLSKKDPVTESLLTRLDEQRKAKFARALASDDAACGLAMNAVSAWIHHNEKFDADIYLSQHDDHQTAEYLKHTQGAVMVTIYKDGEIRGAAGGLSAERDNLCAEIVHRAIEAAAFDPRFLPIEPEELGQIDIVVDLLGEPEQIGDPACVDPQKHGLIVEQHLNRGIVTPGLTDVSLTSYIEAAERSAGIVSADDGKIVFFRFDVERHRIK